MTIACNRSQDYCNAGPGHGPTAAEGYEGASGDDIGADLADWRLQKFRKGTDPAPLNSGPYATDVLATDPNA